MKIAYSQKIEQELLERVKGLAEQKGISTSALVVAMLKFALTERFKRQRSCSFEEFLKFDVTGEFEAIILPESRRE